MTYNNEAPEVEIPHNVAPSPTKGFPGILPRTSKTITFKDSFTTNWSEITITVKECLKTTSYDITYTAIYSDSSEEGKFAHPLYQTSLQDDDESMLEGIILSANPITFQMIKCLMMNKSEYKNYNTGLRPFKEYCGEIMRAMTYLEF